MRVFGPCSSQRVRKRTILGRQVRNGRRFGTLKVHSSAKVAFSGSWRAAVVQIRRQRSRLRPPGVLFVLREIGV
eukprot:2229300-Lingulodinium_polyedra.AAC.1